MRRAWPLLAVLAGAALLMAACASNDSAGVDLQAPDEPSLKFDKRQVELAGLTKDQRAVQTFLVFNLGQDVLTIDQPAITTVRGCDTAGTVWTGVDLLPGEVSALPVYLGPHVDTGPHVVGVEVRSNDPDQPFARFEIRFDVDEAPPKISSGPRLRVDKVAIDTGPVPYDWPMYEQFTVTNDGDRTLHLSDPTPVRVVEGC